MGLDALHSLAGSLRAVATKSLAHPTWQLEVASAAKEEFLALCYNFDDS